MSHFPILPDTTDIPFEQYIAQALRYKGRQVPIEPGL